MKEIYALRDFYNMKSGDGLVILPHFKTWQQTTEYTCAPAAALMVEQYVTGKQISRNDELRIAEGAGLSPSEVSIPAPI